MSKAVTFKTFGTLSAALAVTGTMTACTVFPTPEAPRVMDFPVPAGIQKSENKRTASLRVETPFASEPFNSTRILAKPEPWEFRMYGGVRWRDTTPIILRDMLAGAFRANAGFANVATDAGPSSTNLSLATEITAFHTTTRGDSTRATVAIYGQLIDNRSRVTLCSDSFIVSTPASDKGIDSVIQAFGAAGERLANDVIEWTADCKIQAD